MKKLVAYGLGAGGLAWALNAVPATTALATVRRKTFPRLSGQGMNGHVALTFDDGPDPSSTPAFLDALDALGWKATFFLLGSMVRQSPEVAVEIARRGHEIGLHGDRHVNHLLRLPHHVGLDLTVGLSTLQEAAGVRPRWFRPPYGILAASSAWHASQLGLRPVLWSTWGRDWRAEATPQTVLDDIKADLRPGATVLLHDSDCTSAPRAWKSALGALPLLAEHLDELGWKVGTLSNHGIAG